MKQFISIALLLLLTCCNRPTENTDNVERSMPEMADTYVDTMTLRMTDFNREVICNGHLRARLKSQLAPRHDDVITSIYVSEGQWVKQGALLATTDETKYVREVEQAEREVEKTRIDFADELVKLGYNIDDDLNPIGDIPKEILRRAEVTSGYYTARYKLQTARQDLADCRLSAPISGRISDIEAHLHQRADKFCNIIDDTEFDVEFSVLEAELSAINQGGRVRVSPFVDESIVVTGRIASINPSVNEKGMVKVTARVAGKPALLDGMNVRVVTERSVPRMFVVPKEAVVERDGYNVVFLYDNGLARWTYIDILYSNISHHAITGNARKETSLHEGDIIITSGNLNLADNTKVKIK